MSKSVKKIRITQVKSQIGYKKKAKSTLEALGLKKVNHFVEHNKTPQIDGMIKKIPFLIKVEEI